MKEEIAQEAKELVIARLLLLPSGKKISIGSYGNFTKEELIENINKGNEVGKKIIEIEMDFLKALKKGDLYE
ncbi:MAG: hypothetical protein GW780_03125 [Candidatus Aenigmarchaeota archaeon]|nr:hypothetical protein [Candidatus Aenigmarchaeota archaeon]NCS71134.1 hypothetical protein [Candidatus Aenigmarchaeota archaeon]OIN85514.1 MAG: hypothetical protein AUJ50_04870 [Candidatus Aenigmarchaeota archaeon CG1_02_38_14]PIY34834.1 MAG: hypothetical protein COZ04_05520 [Candidatus Aenigmarchaeota archaeon CG_4_10_14_3_um_filter_37_21]PJB74996.1 MAG: hypothetical protein CO092_03090 [Candidatus Aenigmarchaeota archaeon CG_4_9_14_3_um_filter_37_18]